MSEPFANIDATEQLSAYLDGELTADERRAVEASLQGDAALRAELDALADARAFLAEHGAVSAPAGFLEDVLAAVDEEPEVIDLGWFQRMRRASRQTLGVPVEGIAVAAAALLVVWIALPGGSTPDSGAQDATRAKQAQGMGSSFSPSEKVTDNDAVTDAEPATGSDAGEGGEDAVDTGLKQAKDAPGEAEKNQDAEYGYRTDKKAMAADLKTIGGLTDENNQKGGGAGSGESTDGWGDPGKNLVTKPVDTLTEEPTEPSTAPDADGEAEEAQGTRFSRVPYSYQLTTDDSEVLYRLAAIAAKYRGEVTDTEAQTLEVTELTGSKGATVLVKLPSHALQDFGREISALGLVTATNDNTMFAGDPVEVRVRVELASGAAEGDGTAPNAARKNRATEMDAYQEVEEAL